jgi:predicted  nucleic acid-binding Zn-ribbon protein
MKIHRCFLAALIQAAFLTISSTAAHAQEPTTDGYVTRKEYEDLKAQMLAMRKELEALKKEKGEVSKQERLESHAVADVQKQVAPKQQTAESQVTGDMHKEVVPEAAPSLAERPGVHVFGFF